MEESTLSSRPLLSRLVAPFVSPKRCWRIIIGTVLMSALLIYAEARQAASIERNTIETLFLAAELQTEAGPDFAKSTKIHTRLIAEYLTRMEARYPARYLA